MTLNEAEKWLQTLSGIYKEKEEKTVILCPSFTLLPFFKDFVTKKNLKVKIGAQNISRLPEGSHTGEVNGAQIKDFADYVIVGHSERREFGEDESVVEEKIKIARDYSLNPILCVQNSSNIIPDDTKIVVYEPLFAIGSGTPDSPENAESEAEKIYASKKPEYILYGGSVTAENVKSFTSKEHINGVLVGSNSLNPQWFSQIIENA